MSASSDSEYKELLRLADGHPFGVSCLAFSSDRKLLASGGIESNICVWDLRTQQLIASSTPASNTGVSVLRCVWKPHRNDSFICGIQNGSIAEVTLTPSKISLVGIRVHDYPVERLAVQGELVASGAHKQVRVWKTEADERWGQIADLGAPRQLRHSAAEILVTGVFFTNAPGGRQALLVAYMHYGIILYEINTFTPIKNIPYSGLIGDCDLHPDGSVLAISNCRGAFETYRLESTKRKTLRPPNEGHRPLPIVFVHEGRALFTGSATGKTRLWDVSSRRMHTSFSNGKGAHVLAIATCHGKDLDGRDEVLLAAGMTSSPTHACDIVVWAAKHASSKAALKHVHSIASNYKPRFLSRICHYASLAIVVLLVAAFIHVLTSSLLFNSRFAV